MAPDIDVVLGPLHDGFGEVLYHRGTTHSLWFGFVAGPMLGWLLWRWRDPEGETPLREWIWACILALVTHPILDGFTPYGTQFLAPFDRTRFAFNGIGIIDPFYTVILGWAIITARRAAEPGSRERRRTAVALATSSAYLMASVGLNEFAQEDVRKLAAPGATVRAYPTALQPFLRRVVLREGHQLRVGWHSTFAPGCPFWQSFPEPTQTAESQEMMSTWQGQIMKWFAMEETVVRTTRRDDGTSVVEVEDLRYGLPGLPPDQSMWGVRASYDSMGRRLGPVRRFRRERFEADLSGFGSWVWGEFEGTGLAGEHPPGCADEG